MTLQEYIRRFRSEARDDAKPYLWPDTFIVSALNEAERRACVCARLILVDDDPAVCSIDLSAGEHTYALHRKLYEIVSLQIANQAGEVRTIELRSREWLNANLPNWRSSECLAFAATQGDTSIRIVGEIIDGDELLIECYRLPLNDMESDEDSPEIHEAHHEHLLDWVLHKAFSVPDADGFDPERSAKHKDNFTRHFGPLPDSDMRRQTRVDQVQHNESYVL